MDANLFKYIWRHSKKEQTGILFLVLVSLPFYFLSLELPKSIVNSGILGQGFEGPGSTQQIFSFELPFGEALTGAPVVLFEGFELEQIGLLMAFSFAFLALVLVNGAFKFVINTRKGRMGERMLRRLRYELVDRVLRFPILHMRKVRPAEMATMIKDEVEPLGGFMDDAFVTPVFLGGQALTAMAFILVQSVWLGVLAGSIVLAQAFIIPKLRRRILVLGKQRQLAARQLAGRVGELIDGAVEIQANDATNYERADFSARLGRTFSIRYEIFQRKFFVKFLNNLLSQFTPFLFYSFGGYLAIIGRLDIGALVAVIAAYKDLPPPIKELIDWDQRRADVQIKYEQVIKQFQPSVMIQPWVQNPEAPVPGGLSGQWNLLSATLVDDTDSKLVDGVSFTAELTDHIVVVGGSNSGMEYVGMLLAGLVHPTSGHIKIGQSDVSELPAAVTGRRLAYVGQDAYLFPLSVRENLLYGLKHLPGVAPVYEGAAAESRAREEAESRRADNTTLDPMADWIDYAAAGAAGPEDITDRLIAVLHLVDLEEDVHRFGLGGAIVPESRPEVAEGILRARAALAGRLEAAGASGLVVRFDPERYNPNASLAENLLFGTPIKAAYETVRLAENELVMGILDDEGLSGLLLEMGQSIANTMVEIFADLPPGHPFFEQFSFIDANELPDFQVIIQRSQKSGLEVLPEGDRKRLRGLPFKYIEARHRLGLIDDALEARLVSARQRIAARIEEADTGAVETYRPDGYNAAASLQDNILFGRLAFGQAQAQETVGRAVTEALDQLGLRPTVLEVGLDYEVGVGGSRLSGVQRQKLAIARALLRRPDILIVNEASVVMDGATEARLVDHILAEMRGRGVVWTLQRANLAERFDRVLLMRAGRLAEQGTFSELNSAGSPLSKLMAAG